jgi:hypothetical protein
MRRGKGSRLLGLTSNLGDRILLQVSDEEGHGSSRVLGPILNLGDGSLPQVGDERGEGV